MFAAGGQVGGGTQRAPVEDSSHGESQGARRGHDTLPCGSATPVWTRKGGDSRKTSFYCPMATLQCVSHTHPFSFLWYRLVLVLVYFLNSNIFILNLPPYNLIFKIESWALYNCIHLSACQFTAMQKPVTVG